MKARGWYRGKGSHKKETSVRLENVVSGRPGPAPLQRGESGSAWALLICVDDAGGVYTLIIVSRTESTRTEETTMSQTPAQKEIANAIGRSIRDNGVVTLDWTRELQDALAEFAAEEGGDTTDADFSGGHRVFEAWGAPGNGWRVHLRHPEAE